MNFEHRCLIESAFPSIRNAYDLPIDEFLSRIEQAYEVESRRRGDTDPFDVQMKQLNRMARNAERKFA